MISSNLKKSKKFNLTENNKIEKLKKMKFSRLKKQDMNKNNYKKPICKILEIKFYK